MKTLQTTSQSPLSIITIESEEKTHNEQPILYLISVWYAPLCALIKIIEQASHFLREPAYLRVTVTTKRVNGFFREIELLENRIFNPLYTIYFNYPTFNASHVLRSTKNAPKD